MRESGISIARTPMLAAAVLAAALVAALAIVEAVSDSETRRPPGMIAPWADYILALDEALAAGDVRAARWAYQEAYNAALGSRRWEAMADIGDAALRLGDARRARTTYLTAAFRARGVRSPDGVLRAVEGFVALGDEQAAQRWLREAEDLAAGDASTHARVRTAAHRFAERSATAGSP